MRSISGSVNGMTGAMFLLVLAAGGISVWTSERQSATLSAASSVSHILRSHMDADMMHDAVRADIFVILDAARNAPGELDKNIAELSDHSALLVKNVHLDMQYRDDPAVSAAARAVTKDLAEYVAGAARIAKIARSDESGARRLLPMFNENFEALEGGMSKISDAIEQHLRFEEARSRTESRLALMANSASLAVMLLLVAVIGFTARRAFITPLVSLVRVIERMAGGELHVDVPCVEREDELGSLAHATKEFRDQLLAAERSKAQQAEMLVTSIGQGLDRLARGDLALPVEARLTGPFAKLKNDFNHSLAALGKTMREVAYGTGAITTGVREISQASTDLALRTEQQASNIEQTAQKVAKVAQTVSETAAAAAHANQTVSTMRGDAEQSGKVMRSAVEAMDSIARHSAEISEIIGLIDGIAFQTNLLALNAGVEAARAGESGKGFAVVASEVRALAQRTTDAAQQVKERVTAASEQIGSGVSLVGDAGNVLQRIINNIADIDEQIHTIAASSEGQSSQLNEINRAVSEMELVTQQNAAMVEQANAATRSLASEAKNLSQQIEQFRFSEHAEPAAGMRAAA